MRVVHILDHSIPRATPYARHTMYMLASQRALGWETFQLTGPNHGGGTVTEEMIDGWLFYRTPRPGGILEGIPGVSALEYIGEIAYRIERLARRVRPHILHVHSPALNAVPALHVGRRVGIPVVYGVRAPDGDTGGLPHAPALPRGVTRSMEMWVLKRAHAVTAESEALRNDILARGISPAKVTVIVCDIASTRESDTAQHVGGSATLGGEPHGLSYCRLYEHLMEAM
ncbi:MAG TPA: glycosyltransferase [Burkholderiales bacterium]|nr:glycosyltransferase [Burkholderiales bacterium]